MGTETSRAASAAELGRRRKTWGICQLRFDSSVSHRWPGKAHLYVLLHIVLSIHKISFCVYGCLPRGGPVRVHAFMFCKACVGIPWIKTLYKYKAFLSLVQMPYPSPTYLILCYQTAAGTHQEHLVPFHVGKGPISSKTANAFQMASWLPFLFVPPGNWVNKYNCQCWHVLPPSLLP